MMVRTSVCVLFVVSAAIASPAAAGPSGPLPLVHRAIDASSGAEVRIYQNKRGDVAIEIADRAVSVRKELADARVVTTIETKTDRFQWSLDDHGTTVASNGSAIALIPGRTDQRGAAHRLAAQSSAVRAGLNLLARVNLTPRSPLTHIVMSTKAMLQSLAGRSGAGVELARWVDQTRGSLRMTRVGAVDGGPGECWDLYAKEAIAAFMELEDCMKQVSWWDFWGDDKCMLIYEMRAIGAFSWWIKCVSFQ